MDLEKDLVNAIKLPIEYLDSNSINRLSQNIITDLELVETISNNDDKSNDKSIYNHIFSPSNCFGELVVKKLPNIYTTNIDYLKDTQQLLLSWQQSNKNVIDNNSDELHDILNTYKEIKSDTGFCEKYMYIDWEHAKFLNTNPFFLQIMSVYNLASPLLSLFLPIIILIIPFFILKAKGLEISLDQYTNILKKLIGDHAIGKIFTQFNNVDIREKTYILLSAAFYLFSIYQNILTCIRFYSNFTKIHNYIFKIKKYIEYSILSMNNYLLVSNNLTTYNRFNQDIIKNRDYLQNILIEFNKITTFSISFKKIFELGNIMEKFYTIYSDIEFNNVMLYSFGFNGYLDCLTGLCVNIINKDINFITFSNSKKSKKSNIFKNSYYPALIKKKPIKNTCNLSKNMIITGPNASGKTTILKTCLINVLLSQQFGCGTYSSGKLKPFKHIHCYLNIPDTSGRDSLFQAEARRCKEIIDCIKSNKADTHFCVFDELYSGTNPEEAVVSASAFMEYLFKYNSVTSMLTTHYIDLCSELEQNNKNVVINNHMKTNKLDTKGTFEYTYILTNGISNVKGGLKVLSDMDYPAEILEKTKNKFI
jgi:hypothetical protein